MVITIVVFIAKNRSVEADVFLLFVLSLYHIILVVSGTATPGDKSTRGGSISNSITTMPSTGRCNQGHDGKVIWFFTKMTKLFSQHI